MSDIKKLLEHIDAINASSSSKKQLNEGWTPNEAQRKWLGGADINDPFIIARMPAKLGPKPGIPDLPPADQEIAKQYNRGVDNANRIRSFFGLKTGATQQSASTDQSTTTLPARSSSPTADTQPQPGTTRPGLRIPFQLPDNKVELVPSGVNTQTGIRQQAVPIELNEIEMDESGLQAYLGNKKYGKKGMDALRKAGRDGASKEKMAKIHAKYDKLDEQGVAEGFSDVVKGVKRSIKGKEHPDVVASKHAGRAIGHYNQGDIAAGDKETERYKKIRNMHLKAKGVAEGSSDKVHLKTPKHGLADHPGRNTGVGLSTFAATSEQDRCPKCNSLYKNHYQKQGVAASKDKSDKKS